jgi:predicted nucleotidyltransferase
VTNLVSSHRSEIETLCRTYRVRRLELFGSAARDDFDPTRSDIDFLVEFEPDAELNTFHAYMDLREDLARLLGRPVDLVMPTAIRNRYFKQEIEATRQTVYAA